MAVIFFLVGLLASAVGAVCGVGGGIIIKPALDLFGAASVSTVSFLSGCTVLSMTCYSVGRSVAAKENVVDIHTATPLAIGAAAGGVAGKYLFSAVAGLFENADAIGAVQAVCLFVITIGTLLYMLNKHKITEKQIKNTAVCVIIGMALGLSSSFLGIGGGPVNIVVLYFFFSMDTKTAAQNSLYVILFSQTANLFTMLVTGTIPAFDWIYLIVMVIGGIGGGMIGRMLNKRLDSTAINKLFIGLMCLIAAACVYNARRYAMM